MFSSFRSSWLYAQRHKVVWLTAGVLLILVFKGIDSLWTPGPGPIDQSFFPETTDNRWYQSNISNIQFPIPDGWRIQSEASFDHPLLAMYDAPELALVHVETACVIAKAHYREDREQQPGRKQISFADRVYSDYSQFDGNWYLASTSESAQYAFSHHERQYLAGELRESNWSRGDVFVLFSADGQAVPDRCNHDFNTLLETVEVYFEDTTLADERAGLVEIGLHNPRVGDRYYYLRFVDAVTGERRKIATLPQGGWGDTSLTQVGDQLYLGGTSAMDEEDEDGRIRLWSALYRVDPFTGELAQLADTKAEDVVIYSVYVQAGQVYYLRGVSCFGYGSCPMDLYVVPATGGEPTLLANTDAGGRIIGATDDGQTFYIERSSGDAGAYSSGFSQLTIGEPEQPLENFSGHMNDIDHLEKLARLEAYRASLRSREDVGALYLEQGELRPYRGDTTSGYGRFIVETISE